METQLKAGVGVPIEVAATIRMYLDSKKSELEALQKEWDWIGRRNGIAYIDKALAWLAEQEAHGDETK